MSMDVIKYSAGYEYQLAESYAIEIKIRPTSTVSLGYVSLDASGMLRIERGYAWDGPSGPAIDTRNFMRGSLVHDALYQLIRAGRLPQECRETADKILRRICREDGMSAVRAWWVYQGVRFGGGPAARPSGEPPVLRAP